MRDATISVPGRHEHLDGLADELVARVTGDRREVLVDVANDPALVDEGDAVRQHVEQVVPGEGLLVQIVHNSPALGPNQPYPFGKPG